MRLFIAINLPDAVRRGLYAATEPLRARGLPVKWVQPEGIHLTLKFLGDVPDEREPEITAALARAATGAKPFAVALDGFGVFPDSRRPRVVWSGVEPHPSLELLQDGVERAMGELGFEPEGRAFRPHLTLGRAARDAKPAAFGGLEPLLESLSFQGSLVVESVDLMQSTLRPDGAVYQRRHAHALA